MVPITSKYLFWRLFCPTSFSVLAFWDLVKWFLMHGVFIWKNWLKVCSNRQSSIPEIIYVFKVSNRSTRKSYKICSKLTINTLEFCQWWRHVVFIVNFEHILHLFLLFLLLTLNSYIFADIVFNELLHCTKNITFHQFSFSSVKTDLLVF